ncbi:MAG: 7-cyano-7-deazaguanine synthase QueC [Alphaproteobacteria bacterium]|nr:MAG: 7-cyano-7-deazaguanine synthase QueC [Alphaproteobacteria bacterium]
MKTLVVCSGGMDSVTLAHLVAAEGDLARLMTFNYGQRHAKEIDYAAGIAKDLGVPHDIVDIAHLSGYLSGSALTDEVEVPDGHYAEENMKVTVVPNRNAIMLTIAFGAAASYGLTRVAAAMHAGDHFIYPDCRPEFTDAFAKMQKTALEGMWDIDLFTPFIHSSKAEIAATGAKLKVPFEKSWSCYKGGERHCGRCGTCVERREAFHLAAVPDPTDYADPDFWQTVT